VRADSSARLNGVIPRLNLIRRSRSDGADDMS
jgi:hypothetical protein